MQRLRSVLTAASYQACLKFQVFDDMIRVLLFTYLGIEGTHRVTLAVILVVAFYVRLRCVLLVCAQPAGVWRPTTCSLMRSLPSALPFRHRSNCLGGKGKWQHDGEETGII